MPAKSASADRVSVNYAWRFRDEVVFIVTGAAAGYFRRRKLVSQQVIEKELEDGGLLISARVAHADQIFRVVREWIPIYASSAQRSGKQMWKRNYALTWAKRHHLSQRFAKLESFNVQSL